MGMTVPGPYVPVAVVEATAVTVGEAVMAICCVAKPSVPVAGRVSVALVVGTALSAMVPPLRANAVVEV